MAPSFGEVLGRFKTAPGRKRLLLGGFFQAGRILFPVAFVYRRTLIRPTRVAAVVGSFGKTTTTQAVRAALGLPKRFERGWNAGGFLAAGVLGIRPGARFGALEVGISRKGMMARYARIVRPDITVVTSIGSEHHESLGTLEQKREEKAEMVRALRSSGLAVLNGDDPNVVWMRGATNARVITFGFGETCDVRATSASFDVRTGTRLTFEVDGAVQETTTRLVGRHLAYSTLAAIAVAVGEGVPLGEAIERLGTVAPAPERLEVMRSAGGAYLLVDTYKSELETIEASFDTLAALSADRKIVVLGDIEEPQGGQGPLYRKLGTRAAGVATRVVFVGGERAYRSFAGGARDAGMPREGVAYAGRSPRRAAEIVREDLRDGDIVLIKGRSGQQLERVAFHLAGRSMDCDIPLCGLKSGCAACPATARRRG
jgi:UDP-N-acetylmuramoyl-tripeptide--D-alanyl-D-alanine ligase